MNENNMSIVLTAGSLYCFCTLVAVLDPMSSRLTSTSLGYGLSLMMFVVRRAPQLDHRWQHWMDWRASATHSPYFLA